MKKCPIIRKLLTLSFILSIFFSCDMNIEMMLQNYNENYQKPPQTADEITPQPGDENFFQSEMLFDHYIVYTDGTLNLSAPNIKNLFSLEWTMFDPELPEDDQKIDVNLMTGFTRNTQRYVFYTPTSGLDEGRTYILELKVVDKNQRIYKDTCEISVVKTYHSANNNRSITVTNNSFPYSRTIMPDNSNSYQTEDLDYWLFYTDINNPLDTGNVLKLTPYQFTLKSGLFSITIEEKCYSLELYALQKALSITDESQIKEKAVLSAKAVADLRYTSNVDFYLTSTNATEKGFADIKLYTNGWETDESISVTVNLTNSDGSIVATEIIKDIVTIPNAEPAESNFKISVNPGTYFFNVIFTKNEENFTWKDRIIINSGVTTESSIGIPLVIFTGGDP